MWGEFREEWAYDGQLYWLHSVANHVKANGEKIQLAVWGSHCAKCGEMFLFKMPMNGYPKKPNRRCDKHKRKGKMVSRRERLLGQYAMIQRELRR